MTSISRAWRMLLLFLGAMLVPAAMEGAIFHATASVCNGAIDEQVDAMALAVIGGSPQDSCSGNYGSASAKASSSGLGAAANFTHVCCQTAGGAGGAAWVETQVLISGPPGYVLTSLNLALHGGTGGGVSEDYNARIIGMMVSTWGGSFSGEIGEIANSGGITPWMSGVLAPSGTNCYLTCYLETPEFLMPTNSPQYFMMRLSAGVGTGTGNSYGQATAFDTFYFPLNGPVFNLPEGYDATIYGMNVEGNRVVGGDSSVPEPSTLGAVAGGIALLALRRLGARRS